MRWLLVLALVVGSAAVAEEAPPETPAQTSPEKPKAAPEATIRRLEIVDVKGPTRFPDGYGHEFTVEIEFVGDPKSLEIEWWENVSLEGSDWSSPAVLATDLVRENLWQDHRVVNPDSPMWRSLEKTTSIAKDGARILRIVDRPTIPLGNVRLRRGTGRQYANLSRQLTIEVRARCGGVERSAFVYQKLSEKEGKPGSALIAYGPSRPPRPGTKPEKPTGDSR